MAKKKKPVKPVKPVPLSVGDEFFVRTHFGKTAAELAEALRVPVESVEVYLAKLEGEGFAAPPKKAEPTRVQKAGFEQKGTAVSMTDEASARADNARNRPRRPPREHGGVHIIDPSQPTY